MQGKVIDAKEVEGDMVTSDSFSNWTHGNDVDVLIDGLETFERMFEVPRPHQRLRFVLLFCLFFFCLFVFILSPSLPLPTSFLFCHVSV